MFGLAVRFLDGSSEAVELSELPPDYTIAQLKKDLEHRKGIEHSMQEIKIIKGEQELHEGDRIQLEVQAVIVTSPAKALAKIHSWIKHVHESQIRSGIEPEDLEAAYAALDQQNLPRNFCEQMLVLAQQYRSSRKHPEISIFELDKLGRIFGRACGNPPEYINSLMAFFGHRHWSSQCFASAALLEILSRCKPSLQDHVANIAETARQMLRYSLVAFKLGCELLGHFGNTDDIRKIEGFKQWNTCDAALNAIQAIGEREMLQLSTNARMVVCKENQVDVVTEPEADAPQESTVETENAAELARALINSKQDVPTTGVPLNSDGVVVLRLTRMARSEMLRDHLRTVPTLAPCRQRVQDAGCALEASWSCGAQFFVPLTQEQVQEAELELSYDHVVILNSEVDLFKRALHEFNCRGKRRPTLAVDFGCFKERPSPASGHVASRGSEEVSEEDEGLVEVEPVGLLILRTDSSLGFPQSRHMRTE